jgi:hypothetical protein
MQAFPKKHNHKVFRADEIQRRFSTLKDVFQHFEGRFSAL